MTVFDSPIAGWSHEADRWNGTDEGSYTFFEAAVQNKWETTGSALQKNPP